MTGRKGAVGRMDGLAWAFLIALLATPLSADYQTGLEAYQQGDYDRALGEWLNVARSDPSEVHPGIRGETFYAIAMLYWIGQGVPQGTAISAKWLEQAADLHHAGAQTKLGYLYSSGQGVQQSDFEALKWFQMAAWQGDADAQFNLGVIYRDGLGVEPNSQRSLQWFQEAAANGDPVSAGIVAQYETGQSVGASRIPLAVETTDEIADDRSRASALLLEPGTAPQALDLTPQNSLPQVDAIETIDPEPPALRGPDEPASSEISAGSVADVAVQANLPTPAEAELVKEPASSELAELATVESEESAPLVVYNEPFENATRVPSQTAGAVASETPAAVETAEDLELAAPQALAQPVQEEAPYEQWLEQRNPQHYTIQVIALQRPDKLHEFIRRHPDWEPFALFEQTYQGKPLWVMVQGDYPDVIEARQAVRNFPTDLQRNDELWIRRFVMVQEQLQ